VTDDQPPEVEPHRFVRYQRLVSASGAVEGTRYLCSCGEVGPWDWSRQMVRSRWLRHRLDTLPPQTAEVRAVVRRMTGASWDPPCQS